MQCRKRKIRCISQPGQERCDECVRRGKSCLAQERPEPDPSTVDEKRSLRDWLGQIDGSMRQILQKLNTLDQASTLHPPDPRLQVDLERLRLDLLSSTAPLSRSVSTIDPTTPCSSTEVKSLAQGSNDLLAASWRAPLLSLFDNNVLRGEWKRSGDSDMLNKASSAFHPSTELRNRILSNLKTFVPDDSLLRQLLRSVSSAVIV